MKTATKKKKSNASAPRSPTVELNTVNRNREENVLRLSRININEDFKKS